jgi:phage RecT family recombinase
MTTSTEIAPTLLKWQESLAGYAVTEYNQNAFIKSAMLAITQSPELQACFNTQDGQASLFQAMRFASATGLSLNPQEGKAALIAYKGKAQYQIMKNGMMELAERSGKVKFITSDTVRENDVFDVEKTPNGDKYTFKPARKSRGEIDGFFAAIVLNDGTSHVKYMTAEEARGFRDQYSQMYKFKPQASPWNHSFEGMGLKTVMKSLLRNISISPEVAAAVGGDDESEPVIETAVVKDVTPPKGVSPEDIMAELTDDKDEPFLED